MFENYKLKGVEEVAKASKRASGQNQIVVYYDYNNQEIFTADGVREHQKGVKPIIALLRENSVEDIKRGIIRQLSM